MKRDTGWVTLFVGAFLVFGSGEIFAARISDIANTVHNLSTSGPGGVTATSENRICIFCHTPHGAENVQVAPLWNRNLTVNDGLYTPYTSGSMDAATGQPTQGSSKLCLTCHDGTQAIGAVNTYNGSYTDYNPGTAEIAMTGTAGGNMPTGSGVTTGYTRNLGLNLSNDHPISFTYDTSLATSDGDLRDPASTSYIKNPAPGVKPKPDVPLVNGKVECISCHDPHIRETVAGENIKFLRLNRFQTTAAPTNSTFTKNNDIICLACHRKEGWEYSSHANSAVANEVYTAAAAAQREFPTANFPVWRASCLNCHDTHTVQGARRLLREGTDGSGSPRAGGSAALENNCYQCHSNDGATLTSQGDGTEVENIKSDFALARSKPISNTAQGVASEVHDIGTGSGSFRGKDFIESPLNMGKGNLANRHVECTDCHNPHRVIRNQSFTANPATPDAIGAHVHLTNNTVVHTNLISGVLRGSSGVEPVYGATTFMSNPTGFTVKQGVAPVGGATTVGSSYVTREYQICLKCHSNYAYDTPPMLGHPGGTPSGTNGMTQYTNQAMEFQAPATHKGEVTAAGTGAHASYATNNHRSWHPVMDSTGRTAALRTITSPYTGNATLSNNTFIAPWDAGIGTQTMYCSDCHGRDNTGATSSPDAGKNNGPHGSENNFILIGPWRDMTGIGGATISSQGSTVTTEDLCFKCHQACTYTNDNTCSQSGRTGFSGGGKNLHTYHADKVGALRCNWCHVAVPHGWKNKALLVNLLDVGPEVGLSAGTVIPDNTIITNKGYTNPPYYNRALNKFSSFAKSGLWQENNCVSKDWMKDICSNPP